MPCYISFVTICAGCVFMRAVDSNIRASSIGNKYAIIGLRANYRQRVGNQLGVVAAFIIGLFM
jgi:hypothetical protein